MLSDDIVYVGQGIARPTRRPATLTTKRWKATTRICARCCRRTTQSSLNGLPPAATAGVITSRAASEAFFIDGTNRAMFRFTLLNHLCRDMEQVHDTSRPPDRIRQDVTRSPGGDSSVFLNNCVGCHNGMDPMAQAFAYYDFDETQRPAGLHAGPGAAEVPDQFRQLQAGLRHAGRPLGEPLAPAGQEHAARLGGRTLARHAATARRRSARSSRTATRSRSARSRRCSAPSASARRATTPIARR